mgnify:CR=1 FL=1
MHTGTVLALDNVSFAADRLDRVETTVPDCNTGECEGTLQGTFHGNEAISADDHGNETGNDGGHGQQFPVILIDKHPEEFAEINDVGLIMAKSICSFFSKPYVKDMIEAFKNANVIPTANASILVAMPKPKRHSQPIQCNFLQLPEQVNASKTKCKPNKRKIVKIINCLNGITSSLI